MTELLRRFLSDKGGNFALMAAALAVPVTLGIGMTLDVSTIKRSQSTLQQATDAAVLAVAREGVTLSDSEAYRIARSYLEANLAGSYSNLKVVRTGTTFKVEADAVAEVNFGGLLGYDSWGVKAVSTADIAMVPYEIALVLDTTGSMKGGKLAAMKDAVVGLIETMSANVEAKENLKFAMVPFAQFVNVGPQYGPKFDKKGKQLPGTGAPWLDLRGASNVPQMELVKGASRFQIFENLDQAWPGCVETRPAGGGDLDAADTKPDSVRPDTLFVPAFSIDEPDGAEFFNDYIKSDAKVKDKSAKGKKQKLAKYGVATDGDGNPLLGGVLSDTTDALGVTGSNVRDGGSKGVAKIKIDTSLSPANGRPKGPGNGCDTPPIMALSSDYGAVTAAVDELTASGNTNILEGVAWGWRVLSPGEPFTESAKSAKNTRRIMIVLTDGSNVFGVRSTVLGSSYSSFGFAADERLIDTGGATAAGTNRAMNDRTLEACENAKKDGMEIFTIRLEEPNKTTGMMLKDCASGEGHFFDAPSRTQLDEVFGAIRDKITQVRLSS